MAKIEIAKTELVWPGKYNEDGTLVEVPRVSLPFQVIETINESRATREANKQPQQGTLFDVYEGKEGDTFEAGWRNKLIWGDNLLVMGSLLEKFAGKIDLIYIDPPFATGIDFSFTTDVGESNKEISKEQSVIEEKAYRDTWGNGMDSYLRMISSRLGIMRELLSDKGSIFIHLDWHVNSLVRQVMDDIFGRENLVNELIWHYRRWTGSAKNFLNMHDTIYYYSKTNDYVFNEQWIPYTERSLARKKNYHTRILGDDVYETHIDERGVRANDVWELPVINSQALERTGYATQKPEALLELIVKTSSNQGDIIADFFCGSGTTMAVAEKLDRRWIGCDLGRWAIHTTRKRMLEIENCRPFEVLNLGRYERQYWQGVTFGDAKDKPIAEQALYEYLAFILKLYDAQPLAGTMQLHGKKGKAMVHIGAVDAPVTISEIDSAVDECVKLKQTALHILGWEWEMGLYDLMVEAAKKKGVKLLLLQIPREVMEQQAAAKGDVHFFELAYLEAEINQPKKLTAKVTLKDFVIPNTELIPDEVRSKVKKWSDYIDYWSVDWDFQNDTFMQGWVAYRTRQERALPLASDPHTYEKAGKYRILVKVIDIFGNDTSQAFETEVK